MNERTGGSAGWITSRTSLILSWVGALLAFGLLVSVISGYAIISSLVRKNIVEQTLPLTGDNIFSEVQRDVLRPIFISSVMAQDTFLRDWVMQGENDQEQIVRYLKEIKNKYNTFTSYFISEKTKRYYYTSGVLKIVREEDAHDKWYFSVRAMHAPYRVEVDTDQANRNALTIFINYRVFDYQGNFIGVTGVGLSINAVSQLIDKYESRFHRRIYFVNPDGIVVLASKAMAGAQRSINESSGIATIAGQILNSTITPTPLQYQRDGATILVSSRFIPDLGLFLVVEQNENEEVQTAFTTLIRKPASIAFVLMLALGATVFYTVRRSRMEHHTDSDVESNNNQDAAEIDFSYPRLLDDRCASGEPLSLILLAIDDPNTSSPEEVNAICRQVRAQAVHLVQGVIRKSDHIKCWEENLYLVLLENTDLEQAMTIARKIREVITEFADTLCQQPAKLSPSMGVAQHMQNESAAKFFARADMALLQARRDGGGCVKALVV